MYYRKKILTVYKSRSTSFIRARDSTGMGTGTVPGRNNVASVRSRNIFCSGAGPCEAYNITILQMIVIMVVLMSGRYVICNTVEW